MRRHESKFLGSSTLAAATGFSVALHAAVLAFGIYSSGGGGTGRERANPASSAAPLRIDFIATEVRTALPDLPPPRPSDAASELDALEAANGEAASQATPPSIADEADPDWTPERPSFLDVVTIAPLDDRLALSGDLAGPRAIRPAPKSVEAAKTEVAKGAPVIALEPSPSVKTEAKTTATAPAAGTKAKRETAKRDPKFCRKPAFPRRAVERGIRGIVYLRVDLDEYGVPVHVLVSKSSGHELLDDAALEAVRRWRFIPAREDGKAVASTVILPIDFTDPPG